MNIEVLLRSFKIYTCTNLFITDHLSTLYEHHLKLEKVF